VTVRVERDALADAVAAVKLGTYRSANDNAPVLLEAADHAQVRLTADNLDMRAEALAPADRVDSDVIRAYLPWKTLHGAVEGMPEGAVDLELSEDRRLTVRGGSFAFELASMDPDACPRRRESVATHNLVFGPDVWPNVARVFRARERGVEWPRDLHISAGYAWATNKLVVARTPIGTDPELRLRLPAPIIEAAMALKPTEVHLRWGHKDFAMWCTAGSWQASLGELPPAKIQVHAMFERDFPIEITVNRPELIDAIARLRKAGDTPGLSMPQVWINAGDDGLALTYTAGTEARADGHVDGKASQPIEVGFAIPYLLSLLGMSDDEEITLAGSGVGSKPWRLQADNIDALAMSLART
jgi:hypothetical protein